MLDASLSDNVRGMHGSEILKIAADVRQMIKAGEQVCNLTVGDFDSSQFPIPAKLKEHILQAYADGHTNYPPADGVLATRTASAYFTVLRVSTETGFFGLEMSATIRPACPPAIKA